LSKKGAVEIELAITLEKGTKCIGSISGAINTIREN